MIIKVLKTPNPNSRKFIVPNNWISFTWECLNEETANKSPLAKKLWAVEGVSYLMFANDFVSIIKKEEALWELIQSDVIQLITDFFENEESLFGKETAQVKNTEKQLTEMERKIFTVIEERVQPAIANHGGFVEFVEFENGVVKLDLKGACKGCPSSEVTLKQGIENLLRFYFPEVKSVESV